MNDQQFNFSNLSLDELATYIKAVLDQSSMTTAEKQTFIEQLKK